MVIDVSVSFPDLIITNAIVVTETHSHEGCMKIVDHSKKLVGLSIALGFTKKVRELFGGPRECSHTTALLNAMAPVAIQSVWGTEGREFKSPQPDTQFAGQGRSFGAGPSSRCIGTGAEPASSSNGPRACQSSISPKSITVSLSSPRLGVNTDGCLS